MFEKQDITLMSNPCCTKIVKDLNPSDFNYYDKDGFELNQAEQKFYKKMGYPIDYPILNHCCWQEPWFTLNTNSNLLLDHCMFLCRASYGEQALEQLQELKETIPYAGLLINTKQKWGFDFALDAVSETGTVYEVLHIEYDNYNYEEFKNHLIMFENTIRHTDWENAADKIWKSQEKWKHLKGFQQNHWKSNYLLGWELAEYTEKSI